MWIDSSCKEIGFSFERVSDDPNGGFSNQRAHQEASQQSISVAQKKKNNPFQTYPAAGLY